MAFAILNASAMSTSNSRGKPGCLVRWAGQETGRGAVRLQRAAPHTQTTDAGQHTPAGHVVLTQGVRVCHQVIVPCGGVSVRRSSIGHPVRRRGPGRSARGILPGRLRGVLPACLLARSRLAAFVTGWQAGEPGSHLPEIVEDLACPWACGRVAGEFREVRFGCGDEVQELLALFVSAGVELTDAVEELLSFGSLGGGQVRDAEFTAAAVKLDHLAEALEVSQPDADLILSGIGGGGHGGDRSAGVRPARCLGRRRAVGRTGSWGMPLVVVLEGGPAAACEVARLRRGDELVADRAGHLRRQVGLAAVAIDWQGCGRWDDRAHEYRN